MKVEREVTTILKLSRTELEFISDSVATVAEILAGGPPKSSTDVYEDVLDEVEDVDAFKTFVAQVSEELYKARRNS